MVEVTDRHDGIVVDSQVTTDEDGARAAFELEIPYRELDATLTDLSELGDVISRRRQARTSPLGRFAPSASWRVSSTGFETRGLS